MQIQPGQRPLPSQNRRASPRAQPRRSVARGRLIGIAVFTLGLAALGAMGFWAWSLLVPAGPSGYPAATAERGAPAPPPQAAESLAGADAAKIPASAAAFQGVWEAPFSGGESAVIAFQDGHYQILMARDPSSPTRYAALGAYSYDPATGIAVLEPSAALPEAPEGLVYEALTRRAYKVQLGLNAGTGRLFIKPFVTEGMSDQVHPLFFHADSGRALTGWTRRGASPAPAAEDTP